MAAPSSSSSDATYPSSESDTESATTNYGHVGDEPVHFVYRRGALTWGSHSLKEEDIITVTEVEGSNIGHTIFSLLPADPESKKPFEIRTTTLRFCHKTSLTSLSPNFFDEVLHPVLKAIGLADSTYNVVRTKSAESAMDFARSTLLVAANEGKKQTVLMLSGDGGVVDMINGLLESGGRSKNYTPPILFQLPLGTGNALFHSLHRSSHLPSIYIQGLRTLLHGSPKPLPIFQARFSPGARLVTDEGQKATPLSNDTLYGAVVASYGLHATLVADSDTTEYRKHGDKRFGLVAKDLLFPEDGATPHAYQAQVTLVSHGKELVIDCKEHGYILASLVSNLEKTFTISPSSKPLDGQLRVVNFGALNGQQTMEIMKGAYANGKHVEMEGVGYDAVESLKINFLEKVPYPEIRFWEVPIGVMAWLQDIESRSCGSCMKNSDDAFVPSHFRQSTPLHPNSKQNRTIQLRGPTTALHLTRPQPHPLPVVSLQTRPQLNSLYLRKWHLRHRHPKTPLRPHQLPLPTHPLLLWSRRPRRQLLLLRIKPRQYSNGYIVASLPHFDSYTALPTNSSSLLAIAQTYKEEDQGSAAVEVTYTEWFRATEFALTYRAQEIRAALDSVLLESSLNPSSLFYKAVDEERIGMSGHSLELNPSTYLITEVSPCAFPARKTLARPFALKDRRIKVVIPLVALVFIQDRQIAGATKQVKVPMMALMGDALQEESMRAPQELIYNNTAGDAD
ncbi:hypothetical protein G7Y89_g10582 [Cudoniella acicularis]|uniref:DAGKc domain-containing protein n=1 Tax=Cudoniella acicularis TaxID=354080 RepID=A0A8H4RCG6_9HELO|nr:hypothetical protein G7Y89_g10582 [Cudoniella acicularis]